MTDVLEIKTGMQSKSTSTARMRVLSGIQPTGRFHWGNYFGAIRQYIELQDAGDAYYFIADLHALTTVREPERLRGFVRDAAIDLVALGLDPERATLFVQSDVPEVAISSCCAQFRNHTNALRPPVAGPALLGNICV